MICVVFTVTLDTRLISRSLSSEAYHWHFIRPFSSEYYPTFLFIPIVFKRTTSGIIIALHFAVVYAFNLFTTACIKVRRNTVITTICLIRFCYEITVLIRTSSSKVMNRCMISSWAYLRIRTVSGSLTIDRRRHRWKKAWYDSGIRGRL